MQQLTQRSNRPHLLRIYLLSGMLLIVVFLACFSRNTLAADAGNRQQAIEIAQQQNGGQGKVLGVNMIQDQSGQNVFAVKILTDGRVRVFRIRKAR